MPSNYPAALDDLSNPSGSQRLSVGGGGHAALHTNVNDAIEAIQAALGTHPGVGAVLPFGAVGDGVANDRAALVAGDVDVRTMLLEAGMTYLVGSNLTLTGRIVSAGGMIKPASGVTVTIGGPLEAGRYQIFDLSAGGTVTLAEDAVGSCAFGEWWGMSPASVDNKAAAQAAGRACAAGSVPLDIGPGVFEWDSSNASITIPAGGRFELRGAGPQTVLKRRDGSVSTDFDSLFILTSDGTGDVECVSVRDFSIDANGANNPLPGGAGANDWEHSADIRISPVSGGEFKTVMINRVTARDAIADHIWVTSQYVQRFLVDNFVATDRDRTRSDITFSYYPTYTLLSNIECERIETEALAAPDGGEALMQLVNVHCSSALDLLGEAGVRFELTNVDAANATLSQLIGFWNGGRIRYPNTTTDPRINYPDRFTFSDVEFIVEPDGTDIVQEIRILHSAFWITDITFDGCKFRIDSDLDAATLVAPYAVGIEAQSGGAADADRQIRFINCWFDSRYDRSVDADRPGRLLLKDCDYAGQTDAFRFINGAITSHLVIDGGNWSRVVGLFGSVGGANLTGSMTVRNVAVAAAHSNFTALGGLTGFTLRSDRLIWVTGAPTGGGMAGDRAKIETPITGAVCEWVATTNHATAATWQPVMQVGVLGSIAATPAFVGQIAVAGGEAYIATGVASAADWQQMTP